MSNYLIGLDFGTSQTKICLLSLDKSNDKIDQDVRQREFLKFDNGEYFLPSLIVKKHDSTFSYGDELIDGIKYRFFKMAVAEDNDLLQVTNEDLAGNLNGKIDDFRKYSTHFDIKAEILVVLYLTYIYLYIKKIKSVRKTITKGARLERLAGKENLSENTFAVNLGIPTEWNNPDHINRKIKFQSLLLTEVTLASRFENIESFLSANETYLLVNITVINQDILKNIENQDTVRRSKIINELLKTHRLSVFPESAAGINYLLKTKRLLDGSYATLDIGAGTSDIAVFEVDNNELTRYFCSESTSIASNDFYREYAKKHYQRNDISFDEIKEVENNIRNNITDQTYYDHALRKTRGAGQLKGIEFAIRKTFYRKYFHSLHLINPARANLIKNSLHEKPIIIFGGGANIEQFCIGDYCYFRGNNPLGNDNTNFKATPITYYLKNISENFWGDKKEIEKHSNLLILALGLTYCVQNGKYIPFDLPYNNINTLTVNNNKFDRYFYYDLQAAVYK